MYKILGNTGNGGRQSICSSSLGWYKLPCRSKFSKPKEIKPEKNKTLAVETGTLVFLDKAKQEAIDIIEAARSQTVLMMEEARRQLAVEAKQAKDAATEEGYQQGYQEGLESARLEADQIRAAAQNVLIQAEEVRREQLTAVREEVLRLALDMAEKILARELTTNQEVILNIATEALQLVTNRQNVILWVHPADLNICQENQEHFLSLLPAQSQLQIMTDQEIERGGCVVETDFGKVDAQIQAKWDNLMQILEGEWKQDQNAKANG